VPSDRACLKALLLFNDCYFPIVKKPSNTRRLLPIDPSGFAMNAPTSTPTNNNRRKGLTTVAVLVLLAGAAWGVYEYVVSSHFETTDNAYVQGNLIQITPQISGTVKEIYADDTDRVQAGQPLIKLDGTDAQLALQQASANLGAVVRQVRTVFANNDTLSAQISLREADVARVQVDLERATDDLARRQKLTGSGAVSKEELQHAQSQVAAAKSQLNAAQAAVVAAREQLASNQAQTQGVNVQSHPSVLAAADKVREAYVAAHRLVLPAPVDGYVAKRVVQLGQRVAPGANLMNIVPLQQVWVDANFKEVQLRNLRLGQPVKLTADYYGSKVEFDGKVAGLGMGTGAAFALLPAQNATGNWIKVVQRVPVRIALNAEQIAKHPLRVGLSMEVSVDITNQEGGSLAEATRTQPYGMTDVLEISQQGADELVNQVVSANLGQKVKMAHSVAQPDGNKQ
jgi:membrane fusion protein (multidrug efflux system)